MIVCKRVVRMRVIECVVIRIISCAPREVLNPSRAHQSFTQASLVLNA